MARIKNDPARYVSRADNLPKSDREVSSCARRIAERERSYLEAPISEGFYIDHRHKPTR